MKAGIYDGRNHTLNYIKAIACFCVLMLHCGFPGIVGKLIYGPSRFAVPFFFMVSGYYVYSEDTEKVLSRLPRKIKHIAVLLIGTEMTYLVWHIIQSVIDAGIAGVVAWFSSTFTVSQFIQFLFFQTTPVGDVSWFLVALLLCYIVTYVIAKHNLWQVTSGIIPVLLMINIILGEIVPFLGINSQWYWCSNFLVLGFPFYAMGYWINRNQNDLCKKCSIKSTVLVVLLSIILITIERILTSASQFFVGDISLTLALFVFCVKYPSIFKTRNFVENIGEKYAFYVYILHPIIRDVLYRLILESVGLSSHIVIAWTRPVVVFVICIGISKVVYALGNKCEILVKQVWGV